MRMYVHCMRVFEQPSFRCCNTYDPVTASVMVSMLSVTTTSEISVCEFVDLSCLADRGTCTATHKCGAPAAQQPWRAKVGVEARDGGRHCLVCFLQPCKITVRQYSFVLLVQPSATSCGRLRIGGDRACADDIRATWIHVPSSVKTWSLTSCRSGAMGALLPSYTCREHIGTSSFTSQVKA